MINPSSADRSLHQLLAACLAATVPAVVSPAGPLLMGAVLMAAAIPAA
jgi:hypothetical protein